MNIELSQIEPACIWKNFALLNSVPRPSKKEGKVIAFIKKFGEDLTLETTVDEVGNVIIRKPATYGLEDRKSIVLQSHLDMVCQKNNDVHFNFLTQGIEMEVDGDWVKAKGTTLGADNGLGVAAIMSVLESKDIPHPAIEALFTIDEETGMTGAIGLKPGMLNGQILLNLDTEEDDEIDIGCAGGVDVTIEKTYQVALSEGDTVCVSIKGLQGGHSGMDIIKGLGNANVILGRFLYLASNTDPIQLLKLEGGSLRNAIPREAYAEFFVKNKEQVLAQLEVLKNNILEEFIALEPHLEITISSSSNKGDAMSNSDTATLVRVLKALHNGVYRMSPEVEGLVETSNNIARVELVEGKVRILNLSRSSVDSTKDQVALQLKSVAELAQMEVVISGSYPGWKPKPGSEIVKIMEQLYKDQFGTLPKVVACHAGLECGIIGAHYPKMEMVSFGPTIKGAHSPDERASISSVQKFWSYFKAILSEIPMA